MQRDLERLQAAAARVEADLQRTLDASWTCTVGPGPVLTVSDGNATEQVALESEVEDEEWFLPPGATAEEVDDGLAADADELLAAETTEVLRALGLSWPLCPSHERALASCSGVWTCDGPPDHDVAAVGSLSG